MAFDKVVDSAFLEAGLKKVGDSIRAKAGTSELLEFPDAMSAAVDAIDTSKPEQTKTATPSLSQQTISPDSGKVLSGVTINPITAALLTSLDPDFKEANIAEGVNMFGRIGTHKSGTPAACGTIAGSGGQILSITGLPFAPARIVLAIKNYEANASLPGSTVYGACADKELGLRGGFVNGSGYPRGIGGTATFGNNNVSLTLSTTAGYGYIAWGSSAQYYWIALGE